jgi:hypothetical protein
MDYNKGKAWQGREPKGKKEKVRRDVQYEVGERRKTSNVVALRETALARVVASKE